jgi:succinate dehydrogenase / fumarate reductase membrane anchor subunit
MQKNSTHWLITRLTTLPLAALFIYFITQAQYLTTRVRMEFIGWLQKPFVTGAVLVFILCAFWHAKLGMEEVIIDYVPSKNAQALSLLVNKLVFLILGAFCLYATYAISYGKF